MLWIEGTDALMAAGPWDGPGDAAQVFFLSPCVDAASWSPVLDAADAFVGTRAAGQWVTRSSALYEQIAALVPWEIAAVQVAHTPAARAQ